MPHTYSITSSPAVDRDNMVTSILNAKTSSTTLAADVFDDILLNDLDFLFDCDGDFNMNMLPGATDLMANVSNANYTATNFEQPKTNTSKNTKMELVSRPSPLVADRTREEFPQRPLKQQRTSSHVQGYPVQPHNGIALMNPITSSSKSPPQPAPFSEGRSTPELKSSLIVSNFCLSGITGGRATAHGITAGNNTMSNTVSNLSTSVTAMMAPSSAVVNSKRRIPGPAGKLLHTLSSHPMITDTVNRHINMKQKQTNSTYPSTSGLYSKLLANPKADSHSATSTQPTSSQFPIQSYGQGSDEDLEWGSWQTMLQTLLSYCPAIHMHPQQRTQWLFANHPFFQHNIASILKQGFPSKIPFLVVFVSSFDPCNIDVFATFKDASGIIILHSYQ
jgi:hypothetical protein